MTKGLHIVGSMLRKRSSDEKAKLESREITPSIYKVLPIEEAEEAHAILERNENVGKVVLKVVHE